jgi:abhydrolase domain-containing protein 17
MLDRLHRLGFSVFAYDYRGYGTSNGTPSEQNAYQDTDAAYIYLTQQLKIPPKQIIVYDRSVAARRRIGFSSSTAHWLLRPIF